MKKYLKSMGFSLLAFLAVVVFMPVMAHAYAFTQTVDMQKTAEGSYFFDGEAMSDDSDAEDYVVYHKFSVGKTALIEIYGDSYYFSGSYWENKMHGDFALCDEQKNVIMNIKDYEDSEGYDKHGYWDYSYFLVKPGTYYLRYIGFDGYKLHLDYKYCSWKPATSKNRAKTVKAGKNVSGFFYQNEKKTHWYKLKLTKRKKIKLSFTSYGTGAMWIYLIGPGIRTKDSYMWSYDTTYTDWMGDKYERSLEPGTYYLKVVRKKPSVSGMYSIKWK